MGREVARTFGMGEEWRIKHFMGGFQNRAQNSWWKVKIYFTLITKLQYHRFQSTVPFLYNRISHFHKFLLYCWNGIKSLVSVNWSLKLVNLPILLLRLCLIRNWWQIHYHKSVGSTSNLCAWQNKTTLILRYILKTKID